MKEKAFNHNSKQKLTTLGVNALADALLRLAIHSPNAQDLIDNLVAEPEENIQRFNTKLSNIKGSTNYIDY